MTTRQSCRVMILNLETCIFIMYHNNCFYTFKLDKSRILLCVVIVFHVFNERSKFSLYFFHILGKDDHSFCADDYDFDDNKVFDNLSSYLSIIFKNFNCQNVIYRVRRIRFSESFTIRN